MVTIIDGEGLLLGRLASTVAKRLLDGEEIAIVNAEKSVISGNRARVLSNYNIKRQRGSREGGPFFPRRPDQILKRTIRGMLPYKRQRGAEALKSVKVYIGIPVEFQGKAMETISDVHMRNLNHPQYVTLGAVSTFLGAKY
ncbi:MAG: 50S ribosomal protein L13 [Methanomicrobiales archaeon]|jgi:large subunit ribosomal protein L13|nr:50S ribosomal protein L13 [Methanomicrobiales archaeon]